MDKDHATLYQTLSSLAAKAQWQYVYPVLSRRAEGISLGINLHVNQTCNWHCIYCQVSGLHRGKSPVIDLGLLRDELMAAFVAIQQALPPQQTIQSMVSDIAFAGDGEPTTSPQFLQAITLVHTLLKQQADAPSHVRLITNGSQMHKDQTQAALHMLSNMHGEVWFKLDAGNDGEMHAINQTKLTLKRHLQSLQTCARLCRTWIQTAVVCRRTENNACLITPEQDGYLSALKQVQAQIAGVMLYGASRPSQQPSAEHLRQLPDGCLEAYAQSIRDLAIAVKVYA